MDAYRETCREQNLSSGFHDYALDAGAVQVIYVTGEGNTRYLLFRLCLFWAKLLGPLGITTWSLVFILRLVSGLLVVDNHLACVLVTAPGTNCEKAKVGWCRSHPCCPDNDTARQARHQMV